MEHLDDEKLNALIDNSLSENERREAERHIDECSICRGKVDELISLCDRIATLPKIPVQQQVEKEILKSFRLEKKENRQFTFSIPGYSAIMAGVLAGLLLGYLISPLLQTVSGTGPALYTDNKISTQSGNDDYYLQHLLADNGGDVW